MKLSECKTAQQVARKNRWNLRVRFWRVVFWVEEKVRLRPEGEQDPARYAQPLMATGAGVTMKVTGDVP